jgi:carboxyl-terminal processing protease
VTEDAISYLTSILDFLQEYSIRRQALDWDVIRAEVFDRACNAQTKAETYPAIRRALELLGDHHSFFLDPQEAEQFFQAGTIREIGLLATFPGGTVAYVYAESPAARATIRAGDTLLSINGRPAGEIDVQDWRVLLKQPALDLMIRPAGQARRHAVRLSAETIPLFLVPTGHPLSDTLGYLMLPGLVGNDTIVQEYVERIHQLIREIDQVEKRGWIVDLRLNRGGNLTPMILSAGPLLEEGETVAMIAPSGSRSAWRYSQGRAWRGESSMHIDAYAQLKRPTPPVAFLTSQLTSSAGEFLALAFRGQARTRSFGEPTAGLTSGNILNKLSDGAVVALTMALAADRQGRTADGALVPDEPVTIDWQVLGTEHDPVVAAAIAWLKSQEGD